MITRTQNNSTTTMTTTDQLDNIHHRDRVGVDDFVLLEDYTNEQAFLNNLAKRYQENIIYTYIGQVLIAVNPFKTLPIYQQQYVKCYENSNFYELSPHVFSIADSSYRSMINEFRDQCILISGESGSGKTETSKKFLEFLASTSSHHSPIERVKDKLLYSNSILEAFGNAKTCKNNNSSRFGKYMDVQFDSLGTPTGGHINVYLLEKSRVVVQNKLELNFHIFYLMLKHLDDPMLTRLALKRDADHYVYLSQANSPRQGEEDGQERSQFQQVLDAFRVFNFSEQDVNNALAIVAAVLHLGNIGFYDEDDEEKDGRSVVSNFKNVQNAAHQLQCDGKQLEHALTNKSIESRGESVTISLNREQAIYARDALAKAVYERLFYWLVNKMNGSLKEGNQNGRLETNNKVLIGLLDIYGFEVFEKNDFEQFCINYCNEKLQQLFIELTLKQEQEEYRQEKIDWVEVNYFNNQCICELIEGKHQGIIDFLDEECLRPGEVSADTLLEKLDKNLRSHKRFATVQSSQKKQINNSLVKQFKIAHYAGEVVYSITEFITKNNDLLFKDLKKLMSTSKNDIISTMFPLAELSSKKRPKTIINQFKQSLSELMSLLASKEPWYIRCIKPNDQQRANLFDRRIVGHQVQYLGLMENLRVRRAGFAYRRKYEAFVQRYKCLAPETWPSCKTGTAQDAAVCIMRSMGFKVNTDYALGVSKIFIRNSKTLFLIEDEFQKMKHVLATKLQAHYKRYVQQRKYQTIRLSTIRIQTNVRRVLAVRQADKRRWAVKVIRNLIFGFITRNGAPNEHNQSLIRKARVNWLTNLAKQLPTSVLDDSWPPSPGCCQQASQTLRRLHKPWLAALYVRNISKARKEMMLEKVLAEELFKNKKASYRNSIPSPFKSNRLDELNQDVLKSRLLPKLRGSNEKVHYCCMLTKYDRHGYKTRPRMLVITTNALYLVQAKKFQIKENIPLGSVQSLVTSNRNDNMFFVKVPVGQSDKFKGDLILECPSGVIEVLTKMVQLLGKEKLTVISTKIFEHSLAKGKKGEINFADGHTGEVIKRKDGTLEVHSSVSA